METKPRETNPIQTEPQTEGDHTASQPSARSRWRRLRRALLLVAFTYALLSVLMSSQLLAPPPRPPGVRDGSPPPVSRFERVDVELKEGLRIPVWLSAPREQPQGCVLLFHSRGGSHPEGRMQFVVDCGYAVLAPDFRAHGEAPGELSGFGYLEQAEVRATLELAKKRWPGLRIAAWGWSMGAAAILFAAEETAELEGVILESTYSSLDRAFRNRFQHRFPAWLYPLTYGPVLVAEMRSGLWLDEIQPILELPRFQAGRVLLVQGAADWRVAMSEHKAMLAALPGAKGLILDGLGHEDFFWSGGEIYRKKIRDQLARWLLR